MTLVEQILLWILWLWIAFIIGATLMWCLRYHFLKKYKKEQIGEWLFVAFNVTEISPEKFRMLQEWQLIP